MTFDNRVTLALIAAIFLEAAGAFIWAGQASARLTAAEARIAQASDISERLARVEEQVSLSGQQLARIERKLDRE